MKAAIYTGYGSPEVVVVQEVEKPVPNDDEVLIKVHAAALNALDWRVMRGRPLLIRPMLGGLRRPGVNTPGVDVAGRVESVGKNATSVKPGDDVFGGCRGAFAEYACVSQQKLAPKPAAVSFEDAAAVPVAGLTALQGLRDHGHIQAGQKVLIDGASGGVGTYAIQIAKTFGADVTAVTSTTKLETARSLGADHVIDYTRADFTRAGERYDLIYAANSYRSVLDYRRALTRDGIYVMAGGGWPQIRQIMLMGPLLSRMGRQKFRFFIAKVNAADVGVLGDLLAGGKIVSVIDRRYSLGEAAAAIRYLEAGHARGKVIIAPQAEAAS